MKALRLGIAGLGAASKQILPAAGRLPEIEVSAAADIRPEALREFETRYGGRAFSSVRAMCESDAIDAVWIATPNACHAEHALVAAANGKHIVVEKPMALSLAEAERMIEAAERAGVKLVQGHSKIYDPPVRKAREIVREGRLGRAIQINTWNFNDWLQRPRLASEVDTSQGGGIVYRQGPHQADIVRCIGGGRVRSVRAVAGRWDPHFDTEGDFTAFLEFEDGTPATMVFNAYGYFDITELTWGIGESGGLPRAERPQGRLTAPVDAERKYGMAAGAERREEKPFQPFFGLTVVSCERGVIRQSPHGLFLYSEKGCEEVVCEKGIGRAAELKELLEALRERRDPFPDGRWGKATLEVCLAILESSRTKREIFLRHQVACPV